MDLPLLSRLTAYILAQAMDLDPDFLDLNK